MKCRVYSEDSLTFTAFCGCLILAPVVQVLAVHADSRDTGGGAGGIINDNVNDNELSDNVVAREINDQSSESPTLSPVEMYRKLFRRQRAGHRSAVKRIFSLEKYDKQYNLLEMIYTRLFRIMEESKVTLTENGILPGESFPTNNLTQDAFSNVLENTAFFCDLLLRLPDMSHRILHRKHEWDIAIRWAISFSNQTQIYENTEAKLLHLAAQEMNIIEKEPDYINPFTEENKAKQMTAEQVALEKKNEKKEKKKRKKGPRLSPIGHGEL